MRTIHKFLLRPRGQIAHLMLPAGSVVMRVDAQYGSPYAWVSIDTTLPYSQPHEFIIVATGDPLPDGFWPCSTFFQGVGNGMVWHACVRMPSVPSGLLGGVNV